MHRPSYMQMLQLGHGLLAKRAMQLRKFDFSCQWLTVSRVSLGLVAVFVCRHHFPLCCVDPDLRTRAASLQPTGKGVIGQKTSFIPFYRIFILDAMYLG